MRTNRWHWLGSREWPESERKGRRSVEFGAGDLLRLFWQPRRPGQGRRRQSPLSARSLRVTRLPFLILVLWLTGAAPRAGEPPAEPKAPQASAAVRAVLDEGDR